MQKIVVPHGIRQEHSNDSTATNTIASHSVRKSGNKYGDSKRNEAETIYLNKNSINPQVSIIKKQVNGQDKIVPIVKIGKTPNRSRAGNNRITTSNKISNKTVIETAKDNSKETKIIKNRNKTPGIHIAIINQQNASPINNIPLENQIKRYSSKKDITRNLQQLIPGASQMRSRNQQKFDDSLIVRTKPEENNIPLLSPQQISNPINSKYKERRGSAIKPAKHEVPPRLINKTQYKTFYGKERTEEPKKREQLRMSKKASVKVSKTNLKVNKSIIETKTKEKKEAENNENVDDSDDCKTVIENNCDNDYSLIFESLNGVEQV